MGKHAVVTTDAAIEAALHVSNLCNDEVRARTVEHIPALHLLIVGLSNQRRLVLPLEDLQGLENATHEQLAKYELLGNGTGLRFPALDADFYIPALIRGVNGTRHWMAEVGRRGGIRRTEAKRKAARSNGAQGGRPKKPMPASLALKVSTADSSPEREIRKGSASSRVAARSAGLGRSGGSKRA